MEEEFRAGNKNRDMGQLCIDSATKRHRRLRGLEGEVG